MPRGNRTGPAGMGPMTGRGAGFCAGYNVPGYANSTVPRMGAGMGGGGGRGGGGRGFRNRYYATGLPGWQRMPAGYDQPYMGEAPAPAPYAPPYNPQYAPQYAPPYAAQPGPRQEVAALSDQIKYMEESLKAAKDRIEEIERETDLDE